MTDPRWYEIGEHDGEGHFTGVRVTSDGMEFIADGKPEMLITPSGGFAFPLSLRGIWNGIRLWLAYKIQMGKGGDHD